MSAACELTPRERAHIHFRRRAWQRYGLALAEPDIRKIEDLIAANRAVKTVDFSATRAGYSVLAHGKLIVVLYDTEIGAAVTALPLLAIAKRIREAVR